MDSVQANPAGVKTKLPSLGKAELERAVLAAFALLLVCSKTVIQGAS
jgi:hypothetical protein